MNDRSQALWTDEELQAALDAYLYMLQMELSDVPFSAAQLTNALLSGPLSRRNSASIRYRMRNISAVAASNGLPTLSAFSPAEQVGRNVRAKLEKLLMSREDALASIRKLQSDAENTTSLEVLRALEELKNRLSELEASRPIGIGHNNPPGDFEFSSDEVRTVSKSVEEIAKEVALGESEGERVSQLSKVISSFGLKAAVWAGQRITDFSKASAIAAGSGFGLHLSGLGEQVLSTLRLLFQLF
ncbi:hypothetical protein FNJ84_17195 [Paracoccus sp. M683]|uniref:hypothetical protein n=1 Tax=Paracoccus sp. M683 TaxID=2594268 RepID=UPI00117D0ED8|nr:hypothetical protein [Paracoccus sp. M683]TRW95225.1 hypothetical protein FNJ84_17195 [Paracoccus sp. M683]